MNDVLDKTTGVMDDTFIGIWKGTWGLGVENLRRIVDDRCREIDS